MHIKQLTVTNYKSLRNITFQPSNLTVIVGPNASGKSNIVDCFDFLSSVFTHGLEYAVARKGGYENCAYRKARRARGAIEFRLIIQVRSKELSNHFSSYGASRGSFKKQIQLHDFLEVDHQFSFQANTRNIKSDFAIVEETLSVWGTPAGSQRQQLLEFQRKSDGSFAFKLIDKEFFESFFLFGREIFENQKMLESVLTPLDLLVRSPLFSTTALSEVFSNLSRMASHSISASLARSPGVPTPSPKMTVRGENLPAVIDWLIRFHPEKWQFVLDAMQQVVPTLSDIGVEYLQNRALGLWFLEEGFGRPWTVESISDGTMRSLAIFVALADPRTSVFLIEEPENSVHPWIERTLMKQLRKASTLKLTVVTTHSPEVINSCRPEEVWVCFKQDQATQLVRAIELDPQIQIDWAEGKSLLADILYSGILVEATPGGSS